jgi:hypothetical protein
MARVRRSTAECVPQRAPQRVFLVCPARIPQGLENMLAVIRYRLRADLFSGDIYAFCDQTRKVLLTIEWDGGGLCIFRRRSQCGTYPWPPKRLGPLVEISKEDLEVLVAFPKNI